MSPPPGIHRVLNRCSFFFFFCQLPFSALCCDQVFIISLAISHFLYPCSVPLSPTASASLMCILSYAYLLQVCVLSYFCSSPSFLGADMSNALKHSWVAHCMSSPHSLSPSSFSSFVIFSTDSSTPSRSLSFFVLQLHSFVHLFVNVLSIVYRLPFVCLYGPLAASQPHFLRI